MSSATSSRAQGSLHWTFSTGATEGLASVDAISESGNVVWAVVTIDVRTRPSTRGR